MSHEIQAHEYLKTQGQRSVTVTHGVNGSGSRESCENNTTAYAWSCVLTMVHRNLYRGHTAKEKKIGPVFLTC
jgi:hypothetical protein